MRMRNAYPRFIRAIVTRIVRAMQYYARYGRTVWIIDVS